jgi:hypothetical protein
MKYIIITINIHGNTNDIVSGSINTLIPVSTRTCHNHGIDKSILNISLDNLLTILPTEFLSKNS